MTRRGCDNESLLARARRGTNARGVRGVTTPLRPYDLCRQRSGNPGTGSPHRGPPLTLRAPFSDAGLAPDAAAGSFGFVLGGPEDAVVVFGVGPELDSLGEAGKDIVALAAADYFFDTKYKRAVMENFTNLVPMERTGSLRQSLRHARSFLAQGYNALIFPEGTRSADGTMREFMPLIGNLVLNNKVDVLPLWLGGTHKALPKGAKVPIPRKRKVEVRIGPPLTFEQLEQRVAGERRVDQADARRARAADAPRLRRRAVDRLDAIAAVRPRHRDEPVRAQRREENLEIFAARQRPVGDDRHLAVDAPVDHEGAPGDPRRILDEGANVGVAHIERILSERGPRRGGNERGGEHQGQFETHRT